MITEKPWYGAEIPMVPGYLEYQQGVEIISRVDGISNGTELIRQVRE